MGSKQKRWLLPAVCWSCCSSENRYPSDDIEPAALKNESLDEERSDSIEPACELACERRVLRDVIDEIQNIDFYLY